MDNFEIILEDFKKGKLDKFIFDELKINLTQVKDSHFFDNSSGEDLELFQIKCLSEVLSPIGTGSMLLDFIKIGYNLKDVVIIFSFGKEIGDITFNFSENELYQDDNINERLKVKSILEYLLLLKDKFHIPKIRIGIEPATDEDTCLLEISQNVIDIDNAVDCILR